MNHSRTLKSLIGIGFDDIPRQEKLLIDITGVKDKNLNDIDKGINVITYLHWDGYPLESLPSNFDGANLVELNLQYSKLRLPWRGINICYLVLSFDV